MTTNATRTRPEPGAPTWPEPPPHLHVALEWVAASGALGALRTAEDDLGTRCAASAAAYRAALVAEGGPADDAAVTAALLAELAAWLRALDGAAYAALTRATAQGPLGALTEADSPGDPVSGSEQDPG